ncbi:MAG: NAD(P)H-dependent oxidoreductase [Acutalibacter sp.]|nr:NAD(P)H-dependent oxidoreductase [Acutalibacter sp.]
MNVLVLNGSPKGERSNTLKLTKAFLEGFTQNQNADTEIVDIYKLNIRECLGCFVCWSKTPGKCAVTDDMTELLQKLLRADVVIWSFPLYYYSLPSRLKMVVDRQLPLTLPFMDGDAGAGGHRPRYDMSHRRNVVISTCGFYTAAENYIAVNAQFDRLYGKDGYTALYCGQGELFRVPQLSARTDEYLGYVKQAGVEFAAGTITAATQAKLNELLYPREVFEQMADASWGVEHTEQGSKQVSPALTFTRQMAALYNKSSWPGHDIVVEFSYTDVQETYQIVLGKEGHSVLTENFMPVTTRIETPLTVWERIGQGEIDGQQAMMERLYTVSGDFSVMMDWDKYFGWNGETEEKGPAVPSAPAKQTNMNVMLLPWIAIWVGISINSFWGGIIGIVLCAALPFAFLKYKPTIFEYISVFAVSLVSLLSVLGHPVDLLIPASYLAFGLMWTVTAFMKIPLSARYSMNDYGAEKALKNPLFMRTNRILTACWGVLYLLTPIWTYALLHTSLASWTGLFNSVLPAVMGLFTAWFQKWYPKHFAAGGGR